MNKGTNMTGQESVSDSRFEYLVQYGVNKKFPHEIRSKGIVYAELENDPRLRICRTIYNKK